MRQSLLLTTLVALLLVANGCKHSASESTTPAGSVVNTKPLPKHPKEYVIRLEGTIAEMPVVMYLDRTKPHTSGSYYYSNVGILIDLEEQWEAKPQPHGDSILLAEDAFGDSTEHSIRLKQENDSEYTGTWSGNGKSAPIVLKERYPDGSYSFSSVFVDDSMLFHIHPDLSNTLKSTTKLALPDENMPKDESEFLLKRLSKVVGSESPLASTEFRSAIERQNKGYFDSSKAEIIVDAETFADSDQEGSNPMYDYYNSDEVSVRYCMDDLLVLREVSSSYTGGAHEMIGSTMIVLDLRNKKQLTVSDVTSADSLQLRQLLEKWYRKQYHIAKNEPLSNTLLTESIDPNNNFYITNRGISFVYNPYEITPFAMGISEIFIPFSDLKGKLTPWFVSRMGLKD